MQLARLIQEYNLYRELTGFMPTTVNKSYGIGNVTITYNWFDVTVSCSMYRGGHYVVRIGETPWFKYKINEIRGKYARRIYNFANKVFHMHCNKKYNR